MNSFRVAAIATVLFFVSCSNKGTSNLLDVCKNINSYHLKIGRQSVFNNNGTQFGICNVTFQGIEYGIHTDSSGIIEYIHSYDSKFEIDGLRIGDTFGDIPKDLISHEYIPNPTPVDLKSGWEVAFDRTMQQMENGLDKDAKIILFSKKCNQ